MKSFINSVIIIFCLILISFFTGCKKETNVNPAVEYGTVSDIDGNVYKTVKIGNRWWMAENLKAKRYRNGDSVNYVDLNSIPDSAKWSNLKAGAYCIIDNSDTTSQNYKGKKFGYLYNWYTVGDERNIAPSGWHVPSDSEWKELEIYLGMQKDEADNVNWRGNDQGNKLKIYNGWNPSSDKFTIWGSNESGFTAIGGGCCLYNGIWGSPGTFSTGFWWSSSLAGNQAWYRYLDYNKANVFRYIAPLTSGYSIRCIKD